MGLRSTWQNNQQVRRGAMGAIAGSVAGITAAAFEGAGLFQRYGVAIFVGIVVFIALKLLLE